MIFNLYLDIMITKIHSFITQFQYYIDYLPLSSTHNTVQSRCQVWMMLNMKIVSAFAMKYNNTDL